MGVRQTCTSGTAESHRTGLNIDVPRQILPLRPLEHFRIAENSGLNESAQGALRRAYGAYSDHYQASCALAAHKRELLTGYDVAGMNRAVAICHWGRSGSLLLASYLDGHPDIVMLPHGTSENIYPFLAEYGSLRLWEKLIAYPVYSAERTGPFGDLFLKDNPEGDFAIDPADYYAAVLALFEVLGDRSAEWLESRVRFFQVLHIAYTAAIGRHLANPRPLMVFAQHWFDQPMAERFVEDFPLGKFIHTVRDPISAVDSWFEWKVGAEMYRKSATARTPVEYIDPAVGACADLLARGWDGCHRGMEARSRAIRFEDMHLTTEPTLRRLADWLAIGFDATLLQSTWNGRPYVVTVRGKSWCGANPANAERRSKNLSFTDRLVLFVLMHEHFERWRYPFPKALRRRGIRSCVIALLWLIPMKPEVIAARRVLRWQALPSLRQGRLRFAFGALPFLLKSRLRMMRLVLRQSRSQSTRGRKLLELV